MKPIVIFVKRLAVFVVFTLVCYILLIFVGGKFLPNKYKPNINYQLGHNYLRLKEVKQTRDVDLLFVGSSHAYRGFDTRIYQKAGYSVFNLGSSSQTPTQTLVLLKRYLKGLNPKLVVLEVFPDVFTSDGVESSIDLIVSDKNDWNSFKMMMFQKNMKVFNTYIYVEVKNLIETKPNFTQNTYHSGGYVSKGKLRYNNSEKPPITELKLDTDQVVKFEIILKYLKTNKIEYMLVQAPITTRMYQSYTNINEFNRKINTYGNHFNFNTKLMLNDSLDFYDNHHLNENGVTEFNEAFLKLLDRHYKTLLKPSY